MQDKRATTKMHRHVKEQLVFVKKELKLSNESEAIDYLYHFYRANRGNLSLVEHEKLIRNVHQRHNG
ncbi:hypothetical protein M5X00_05485 [Paenibacillus alvei]|uniref:hypothetical protein n=1 Tax=Paenibacillus alvei TaxID=44250 RepID=UPI000287E53B|nr:hypothetical protein [Paenibacillus alvei]EJW19388.1 hypothetical protein PAV_1c03620 [Paenibacillus alvei DSM 29]MCY9542822.1 hypothetical protein [Paenibacillus alvei]MCY9707348.1 hypothetical protein [Paenibacillus alvei]MCY9737598.1 hypothetical protein [Paenibacillus alvei]MCY9753709.1 hypothetical protein [Paenibacillus alvei]